MREGPAWEACGEAWQESDSRGRLEGVEGGREPQRSSLREAVRDDPELELAVLKPVVEEGV